MLHCQEENNMLMDYVGMMRCVVLRIGKCGRNACRGWKKILDYRWMEEKKKHVE